MTPLDTLLAQADTHCSRREWEAARDCLGAALRLSPDEPELLRALGNLHYLAGDFAAAGAVFAVAAERQPDDAGVRVQLALACRELAQFDAAEAALGEALALQPEDPVTWRLLADCYREHDRHAEAAAIYQALLARNPDQVDVLLALGKLFYLAGDFAGARAALHEVLRLEPANTIAWENLATLELQDPEVTSGRAWRRSAGLPGGVRGAPGTASTGVRRGPPPRRRGPRRRAGVLRVPARPGEPGLPTMAVAAPAVPDRSSPPRFSP